MRVLADLNLEELKNLMQESGEKSFHALQIYKNVQSGKSISEMTDISKALREKLLSDFCDTPCEVIETKKSKDGTEKYLIRLHDGNVIESVFMTYKYGNTQCISTQVGCRMGCAFCASGIGGLVRNMTSGEILSEVAVVNRLHGGTLDKRSVTNIVLMGSGEPLDNYDNVVRFLKNVSAKEGLNISQRNISLSTCGLVPQMLRLADEGVSVNLTVSLHNAFDEGRKQLMPIAKKYKISEILDACSHYFDKTGRRYIFEYSLVKGKNDGEKDAEQLIKILKGRPCHVNLIRLNEVKEKHLLATSDKSAYAFAKLLNDGGISATVRRQLGNDIDGACGQLRRKYINGKEEDSH